MRRKSSGDRRGLEFDEPLRRLAQGCSIECTQIFAQIVGAKDYISPIS